MEFKCTGVEISVTAFELGITAPEIWVFNTVIIIIIVD